jgi:hypothetical protein
LKDETTWVFIAYCCITPRQTQLVRSFFSGWCKEHIEQSCIALKTGKKRLQRGSFTVQRQIIMYTFSPKTKHVPNFTVSVRPGEAYKPQCLAPTVKFGGGSVKIWGVAQSHPKSLWKTGGEHAKTHESCDWKSGLFHQILISVKKFFLNCIVLFKN